MTNQRRLADNVNRYKGRDTLAYRASIAAGHRDLWPLWATYEPAVLGAEGRLPRLLLPG